MCRFLFLLWIVAVPAFASQVAEDPRERDMLSIAHELRCAVCQNQSIAESDADLARDMRQIIREQLAAGKSRAEIVDYFVGRYGDYVVMKPRYAGPGVIVWLGPVLLVLALAIPALVYLRRRLRVPAAVPPTLSPEDAARVREAQRQAPE
jgi:cytochrome c-type biogenesis protein CcmH